VAASGLRGALGGYLALRWPANFDLKPLRIEDVALGPFEQSKAITCNDAIRAIPTPGHTPDQISVVTETARGRIISTGDATYSEASLCAGVIDGVAPREASARSTLGKLVALANDRPTLSLPAHDPDDGAAGGLEFGVRLRRRKPLVFTALGG